jgi:hypothetical protein
MLCIYELTVRAICPVDGSTDIYTLIVKSHRTVMVEKIVDVAGSFALRKITQEELTGEIAARLGCRVMSTGYHSGVKTTVTA